MRRVTVQSEKKALVVDAPVPKAKDDWVVVKVYVSPMCTEYKSFVGGSPSEYMGHEAAGEVVEVDKASKLQVGDRVAVMPQNPCGTCALCESGEFIHCQDVEDFVGIHGSREGAATMAQYLLKQERQLVPIPDDISYEHGAMACCGLGPTFGAFQLMDVGSSDTVMITGLGPVGLGGIINATDRGARTIGVDSNKWRAQLALELGAEVVIDPTDADAVEQILALTNGLGVDCTVDCSGVVAAHRLGVDATRRKGKVAFVGESGADTPVQISRDMIRKGLFLIGSWHYNINDTDTIMQIIARNGTKLDKLISHTFSMEDVQEAFELQLTGESAKVLLKPWG